MLFKSQSYNFRKLRGKFPFFIASFLSACGSRNGQLEVEPVGNDTADLQNINRSSEVSAQAKQAKNETLFLVTPADNYWVKSLQIDDLEIIDQLFVFEPKIFLYAFPQTEPNYFDKIADSKGWQPVTDDVEDAVVTLLSLIDDIVNVDFQYTENIAQPNVISFMSNQQHNTDAYAYFPDPVFSIGSDIFIDDDLLKPLNFSHSKTNYDYEAIVHELGHALGLKHPFATLGENSYMLPNFENTTKLTAMSYSENQQYYDGNFRPFDYLALVEYYGIEPTYRASNDVYSFSQDGGVYIIDADGIDEINCTNTQLDAFIDLRENSHSYLGSKHQYISGPYQMTISKHSQIENVFTGPGDDYVIGNSLNNVINTNAGNDIVFSGEGRDILQLGAGHNKANIYEDVLENDFILFSSDYAGQFTEIYNFSVTGRCDVLVIDCDISGPLRMSQVFSSVDQINFKNFDILRVEELSENWVVSTRVNDLEKDKILIVQSEQDSIFDVDIYLHQSNDEAREAPFLIASLQTLEPSLENWSVENFLVI